RYFGENRVPCGNCDICLSPVVSFDGTDAARKALSAVYRTGQRFGAGHVIDVLLGGDTDRVRTLGHDQLSTYGIGTEYSRRAWQSIFRQLTALGLLVSDTAGHGGLSLGGDARAVLRGERPVRLRQDPDEQPRATRSKSRVAAMFASDDDQSLFQALRARRLTLAQAQGVPPYLIFHDSTLVEMARVKPLDRPALAQITGVGEAKLARYGQDFIAVVRRHVETTPENAT
ncbi:MAG: ATP-dependent DNA helicase RecQ, partial [Alphaproteobacteria bacterium]|nr:ATP-dependent DNA helicase RecQ [Alphaproteobacteria bacterium]